MSIVKGTGRLPVEALVAVFLLIGLAASASAMAPHVVAQLNDDFTSGTEGVVGSWAISPDSEVVVYIDDIRSTESNKIFKTTPRGGDPVLVFDGPTSGGKPYQVEISANGEWIVFATENKQLPPAERHWLYSIPMDGGDAVLLAEVPLMNGGILFYEIAPDSQSVTFAANLEVGVRDFNMYTVPIDGGPVERLNQPKLTDNNAIFKFRYTPDETKIVFLEHRPAKAILHVIPASGGDMTMLSSLADDRDVVESFTIDQNSEDVIFAAGPGSFVLTKIYKNSINGGEPVLLSALDPLPWRVDVSPTNPYVVFIANGTLYSMNHETTNTLNVLAHDMGNLALNSFEFTPSGNRVVAMYFDLDTKESALTVSHVESGNTVRLTPENTSFYNMEYELTRMGSEVVFTANLSSSATAKNYIFKVPTWGSMPPESIAELPGDIALNLKLSDNGVYSLFIGVVNRFEPEKGKHINLYSAFEALQPKAVIAKWEMLNEYMTTDGLPSEELDKNADNVVDASDLVKPILSPEP